MGKSIGYSYKRKGLNITVIVQDETFRKLEVFKWNESNKNAKNLALKTLQQKYNLTLKPLIDPDLDWLR